MECDTVVVLLLLLLLPPRTTLTRHMYARVRIIHAIEYYVQFEDKKLEKYAINGVITSAFKKAPRVTVSRIDRSIYHEIVCNCLGAY